jgi:hypothetical protein
MVTKKVFGHHKSVVTKNLLVIMQLWQWVAIEKNLVTMQLWRPKTFWLPHVGDNQIFFHHHTPFLLPHVGILIESFLVTTHIWQLKGFRSP